MLNALTKTGLWSGLRAIRPKGSESLILTFAVLRRQLAVCKQENPTYIRFPHLRDPPDRERRGLDHRSLPLRVGLRGNKLIL